MFVGNERSNTSSNKLTILPHVRDEDHFALIFSRDQSREIIGTDKAIRERPCTQSLFSTVQAFAIQCLESPADENIDRLNEVACDMNFHGLAILSNREQQRRVKTLCRIME